MRPFVGHPGKCLTLRAFHLLLRKMHKTFFSHHQRAKMFFHHTNNLFWGEEEEFTSLWEKKIPLPPQQNVRQTIPGQSM